MKWNIDSDYAIYPQIVDEFIKALISGELVAGQRLSSVRELASEAAVNPNTMQRALAELERRELVKNMRTSGKSVTEDVIMIEKLKEDYAKKKVEDFVSVMKDMGFSVSEIINMLEQEK